MKKSILMIAFTALVGAAFAFSLPQEAQEGAAKKSCTKKERSCCKKGEAKSCDKKTAEKAEAKPETKSDVKAAEPKK